MKHDNGERMAIVASDGTQVYVRIEVNAKAKRLILRLDERRREAVTVAPSARQIKAAVKFAQERVDWIAEALGRLPEVIPFEDGAMIGLRGEPVCLSIEGTGRLAVLEPGDPPILRVPGAPETFGARVTRYLKKEAKGDISEAVARYSEALGVTASAISLKDTRSRWGSCTADRKLSFSWRLVLAPPRVLDYVAAHECAHMLEMNHSPAFWAHVTHCIPDWKRDRAWLRAHGAGLQSVGL